MRRESTSPTGVPRNVRGRNALRLRNQLINASWHREERRERRWCTPMGDEVEISNMHSARNWRIAGFGAVVSDARQGRKVQSEELRMES